MVGSSRVLRVSLGAVYLFWFLCFIFLGILSHQARSLTTVTVLSTGRFQKSAGKQRHSDHHHSAVNYVSKRRVPNGPDPIHNRRAGTSTEPRV